MKRSLIAVLTIAVLLLAFAGLAVAADNSEVAAERLFDLGFIEGYEDGSFRLDNNITRAEFAKVAVVAAGYADAEKMLRQSSTDFSDVGSGLWYTGWINVASSQGFVKGDPAGTFRPNDTISAAEVVTVLLRVLGYNDNLPGQWPTNYLVKGAGLGITSGIPFDANAPIDRGSVFQMLSKTLDEDVVEYDADKDVFKSKDISLLEDSLELVKVKGIVTAISRVDSSLEDNEIELVADFGTDDESSAIYEAIVNVDYEAIFGARVNVYVNDDKEIVNVSLDNDWTVYLDAIEVNAKADELELVDADKDYDIRDYAVVYIDGKSKKVADLKDSKFDYAKVLLDSRNRVAMVDAYNWEGWLIVEDVDGNDVFGYGDELDAKDVVVVKDGKTIDLDELEEGDILFYNLAAGDGFAEVYNKSVTGEITRIYDDSVTVESKNYKFGNAKYINEKDKAVELGESASTAKDVLEAMEEAGDVSVYLDRKGDMVFISGDIEDLVTTSEYYMVTSTTKEFNTRGTGKWTLDVIDAAGKTFKYDVKKSDVDAVGDSLLKNANGKNAVWSTSNVVKDIVVEIAFDRDGDIDEVVLLDNASKTVKTDADAKYCDGKRINSDAIVFLAEDFYGGKSTDTDDIDVATYADLDFDYFEKAVFYFDDNKAVAIVVDESSRKDEATNVDTVLTANPKKVSGKQIWTLSVVLDGAKKDIDTKASPAGASLSGLAKGDFVNLSVNDATGKVDKVVKITSGISGTIKDLSVGNKKFFIGSQEVRLGADGVVVDSTDKYKPVNFNSLRNGDKVAVVLISSGSVYSDIIVKLEKDAVIDPTIPGTDGKVTYIDATKITVGGIDYKLDQLTVYRPLVGAPVIGGASIVGALNVGDLVNIDNVTNGVVTSLTELETEAAKLLTATADVVALEAATLDVTQANNDAAVALATTAKASVAKLTAGADKTALEGRIATVETAIAADQKAIATADVVALEAATLDATQANNDAAVALATTAKASVAKLTAGADKTALEGRIATVETAIAADQKAIDLATATADVVALEAATLDATQVNNDAAVALATTAKASVAKLTAGAQKTSLEARIAVIETAIAADQELIDENAAVAAVNAANDKFDMRTAINSNLDALGISSAITIDQADYLFTKAPGLPGAFTYANAAAIRAELANY